MDNYGTFLTLLRVGFLVFISSIIRDENMSIFRRGKDIVIVTTPTIPGYDIKSVIGVVTGLTARTRGAGGKFVAGIQSMLGGEVSAFTSEIEKARLEAIERMKRQAHGLGANAIIGLDIETSDILQGTVLISVTGTAVVAEPK